MEPCVLFFDSFFHGNEQCWIDMVKFSQPVRLSEIRIVPDGEIIRVGYMLREGSTKPTEIDLDFYARDVENPETATFVSLGGFDYSDDRSSYYALEKRLLTDVLLVKGTYKCLTLAIIGFSQPVLGNNAPLVARHNMAFLPPSSESMPLPPPLIAQPSDEAARFSRENNSRSGQQQPAKRGIEATTVTQSDDTPRPQLSLPPPVIEIEEFFQLPDGDNDDVSSRLSGLEDIASLDNFSTFCPQEVASIVTGDLLGSKMKDELEKAGDEQGEEDFMDTLAFYQQEHEQLAAVVAAAAIAQHGVEEHRLSGLGNFTNPSSTPFEIAVAKFSKEQESSETAALSSNPPREAQKLLTLVEELLTSGEDTQQPLEGMVKTLEQACSVLAAGLAYWYVYSESTFADLLDSLCEWALTAVDYEKVVKLIEKSPIFKVRALKAGLHLLCELVTLSPEYAHRVLHDGRIQSHLLQLLLKHFSSSSSDETTLFPVLTSPIENLIVRTLFYTCVFEQGASSFATAPKDTSESLYMKFLMWLISEKAKSGRKRCVQRRSFNSTTFVLKTISILEMSLLWRSLVAKLSAAIDNGANETAPSDEVIEQICECFEWCGATWSSLTSTSFYNKSTDNKTQLLSFSRFLRSMKLTEVMLILLSSETISASLFSRDMRRRFLSASTAFLDVLSSSKPGLLFLLCDDAVTTRLIGELVMMSGRLQQIGVDLSYRLLMVQLLDQLILATQQQSVEEDNQQLVILRTLAGLASRQHCTHLLAGVIASDSQHIDLLLRIAETRLSCHNVNSPEFEHAMQLLVCIVNHLPTMEPVKGVLGNRIFEVCKQSSDDLRLANELKLALPFLDSTSDSDNEPLGTQKLCQLLKQVAQPCSHDVTRVFSAGLQVAIRLVWLSIKPPKVGTTDDDMSAIERQAACVEFWDKDIISTVCKLLQAASRIRIACIQQACFPPPPQQQILFDLVEIGVNIISTLIAAISTTGVVLFDLEPIVTAMLNVHASFCSIPPSSPQNLCDSITIHKALLACCHEILLLPAKTSVGTRAPVQIRFFSDVIKLTMSLPSLHLSGFIILADLLSPSDDLCPNRLHAIRQTFAMSLFNTSHHRTPCDLSQLVASLYVTDSPPLQAALFRCLLAIASINQTTAVGVLRIALSIALDNLSKVASSLRTCESSISADATSSLDDSNNNINNKSPSENLNSCFSGDFVSSPFYAACKALALCTHLIVTSPTSHAVLIGELSRASTDRHGQPFRQIITDLATLLAGCCRRLARLSPLCAVEFMLHAFDFYTQLISPNFVSRGGVTRFLPIATLAVMAEASFRCLSGPRSSLASANLTNELNISGFSGLGDGVNSPTADLTGQAASPLPSGVQQAAWRLLYLLAEERESAAIWAVTDKHPDVIRHAVLEACEPIASGASSLDEEALALLTEMVVALSSLASRHGCGQKVGSLVCHGDEDGSNPLEQLLQQLTMMDFFTGDDGDGIDMAAAATAEGATLTGTSGGGAMSGGSGAGGGAANSVDASGLTDRLQHLVDDMKRPNSSDNNANESVPASNEIDIGQFLEEVFDEAPLDPFDSEDVSSYETVRFWWLVSESVHDASCTVESFQRVRVDLDAAVRRFCENVDVAAEISQTTSSLVDHVTAPGCLAAGSSGFTEMRRSRSTINTSRQMRRYVAPMRGRGWLGPPSGSGHRAPPPSLASLGLDGRGRAPNTSRPPSMHVDDFQRFERVVPPGSEGLGRGYRGGYRGRNFDPTRAFGGRYSRGFSRAPLLPTPAWSSSKNSLDREGFSSNKPGGAIVDELLALANDPVVQAAAISGLAGANISQPSGDLAASVAAFPFLNTLAQSQQQQQPQTSQPVVTTSSGGAASSAMEALLKAASSNSGDTSTLPPCPLPIPLQILPLLPPDELAKLAATMFENNEGDGQQQRQRSPSSSSRRRRATDRSDSDSSGSRDSSRHRSSSRRT